MGWRSSRGRGARIAVDAPHLSKEDGMKGLIPAVGLGLLWAVAAAAQEPPPSPSPSPPKKEEDQTVKREETVVVSASKSETTLINAPATLSVVTEQQLITAPAQNYGDLLR